MNDFSYLAILNLASYAWLDFGLWRSYSAVTVSSAGPRGLFKDDNAIQYSVFSNFSATVTVSPSGPPGLFKGVTTPLRINLKSYVA